MHILAEIQDNLRFLPSLIDYIIPFFNKYPILGNKSSDFADFCKVAHIIIFFYKIKTKREAPKVVT